jgi:hypothetical protein
MLHPWFIAINHEVIEHTGLSHENQLMVDNMPNPLSFQSFRDWLKALKRSGVQYVDIASVARVTPQMVNKCVKSPKPPRPSAEQLERLSSHFGVLYADLHQLVFRIKLDTHQELDTKLMATTTAGAEFAREWEQLKGPVRDEVRNLVRSMLAMQRAAKTEKT